MEIKNLDYFIEEVEDQQAETLVGGNGNAGSVIPDFVATWHGVGSDHQAGNNPGDTASERHNFANATAGGSNINPTGGNDL